MTAFQASQVSVGTTAVELLSGLEGRYQVIVEVLFTGDEVWLGDSSGVTTGNGFGLRWQSGAPDGALAKVTMDVLLDSTDSLWAVADSNSTTVSVMVNPR
jgi:hypothetical protein